MVAVFRKGVSKLQEQNKIFLNDKCFKGRFELVKQKHATMDDLDRSQIEISTFPQ